MKVISIEEIEVHKAWRQCMGCAQCNELKYSIHHQTEPEEPDNWWVQCPNCGHEGPHSPSREIAIARWRQET